MSVGLERAIAPPPTSPVHPPEPRPVPCHASEGAVVIPAALPAPSLAAMLTAHVLRNGEVVLLALKPSLWLILFQSLRFCAAVLLGYLITRAVGDRMPPGNRIFFFNAAVFLIAGRLMAATLVWMGRLYVLTDQRVIRLAGVFNVDIHDCPLRKVESTTLTFSAKERLCRVGSIEIHAREGCDENAPHVWRTVPRPVDVNEQITAAVRRAQSGTV